MQEILKYQDIDAKIRKLESELATSVNRKKASDMQQYLKDGQVKLFKVEENAKALNQQYEKAVELYNEFISKLEKLVKSIDKLEPEKVASINTTINTLVSTSTALEKNINNLARKIDEANQEADSIMTNAKKAQYNLGVYKQNLSKEKEQIEPEIERLKNELKKQKSKVGSTLLSKYNSKIESDKFPIFVPAKNQRCGRCGMEISSIRLAELKDKGLIECESCGRFIYNI